jgi:hypothetical protein
MSVREINLVQASVTHLMLARRTAESAGGSSGRVSSASRTSRALRASSALRGSTSLRRFASST